MFLKNSFFFKLVWVKGLPIFRIYVRFQVLGLMIRNSNTKILRREERKFDEYRVNRIKPQTTEFFSQGKQSLQDVTEN